MSYSNPYLIDFAPVFCGMLAEKQLSLGRVVLEVIDEEAENYSRFEPTDTLGVLEQIGSMLNYLTIYTERPQYFYKFAKRMYDENGLLVSLFPKGKWRSGPETEAREDLHHMVLDFEWIDAVAWEDVRRPYGEARMVAIGYIGLRLYVVVYVDRDDSRRIISLRKANSREVNFYANR